MKKLLVLCLMPTAMLLAMETIDDAERSKIQRDPLCIVSLIEAYTKGKLSINKDQICFGKYNYKPTLWSANDPSPYSLKMNTACQVLSGMGEEIKERFAQTIKWYNEDGKEMLKENHVQWLVTFQATRLAKFLLNEDLPVEVEKEKHAIIAKRQRWEKAFATQSKSEIMVCLKDLSFVSKLPPLQEAEITEKKRLTEVPVSVAARPDEDKATEQLGDVQLEDEYKTAEELENERIAMQQSKKELEQVSSGWNCIVS